MVRLLIGLAASLLFAGAAEAQEGRQSLAIPVPGGWQITYTEEHDQQRLVEYQPPGQDIHNYRDMLTIIVISRSVIPSAKVFAGITAKNYQSACPSVTGMEIDAGKLPPQIYRFFIVCPLATAIYTDKQKREPYAELAMHTVFEASRVIYVVKRIWRTPVIADVKRLPVPDSELNEEVDRHGDAVLCGEAGVALTSREPAGKACLDLARTELAKLLGKGDQLVAIPEWVP